VHVIIFLIIPADVGLRRSKIEDAGFKRKKNNNQHHHE